MAYADHLRKLLSPLGVYDLGPQSVSGAMVDALGDALDEVWQTMQDDLRDAFPQTAGSDALTQWERVLPLHGQDPSAEVRREAITHLLSREQVSCSAPELEGTLDACGLQANLEMNGADQVRVCTSQAEQTALSALVRSLIPAHLDIEWRVE